MWTELPAAFNRGHAYRDRVGPDDAGRSVSAFYAARYRHSNAAVWQQRLAAAEICRNGQRLRADVVLAAGDQLIWHRPPWQEPAVPELPGPLFDDGDLLVFNKPSGLPVLPAGGFLAHTLLAQLQARWPTARPVHRLGRCTSGLLVCARSRASRAWLSALLRDSTAQQRLLTDSTVGPTARPTVETAVETAVETVLEGPCRKTYRGLLQPPAPGSPLLALQPGESLVLTTPIARRPHGRLGTIWAAAGVENSCGVMAEPLAARSTLRLLERGESGWLVAVTIASGRPHQIRIHTAAAGAPLLGDPLYAPGGPALDQALPGDGGYQLHAHRLRLPLPAGQLLALEAPLPPPLRGAMDG